MKLFSLYLAFISCLILPSNILAQGAQMDIYSVKPSVDKTAPNKIYIPKNLNDCFMELKRILPSSLIAKLKDKDGGGTDNEEVSLAMWIEKNWGLRENSELAKYFESYLQIAKKYEPTEDLPDGFLEKNIVPGETINFIVHAFQMYLRGEITDGQKHMELIKRLIIASTPPKGEELIFSQCKKGVFLEGEIESGTDEDLRIIHYGRCQSTNELWVFELGKGWYSPDATLAKQISSDSKLPKFQPIIKPKGTNEIKRIN